MKGKKNYSRRRDRFYPFLGYSHPQNLHLLKSKQRKSPPKAGFVGFRGWVYCWRAAPYNPNILASVSP